MEERRNRAGESKGKEGGRERENKDKSDRNNPGQYCSVRYI